MSANSTGGPGGEPARRITPITRAALQLLLGVLLLTSLAGALIFLGPARAQLQTPAAPTPTLSLTASSGSPVIPQTGSIPAQPAPSPTATPSETSIPAPFEILLAAGDIASCRRTGDEAVAALIKDLPGTVALLGDIAYEDGSQRQFSDCFDPAWGELRPRLKPSPGNHEYHTPGAAGYFDYFDDVSGLLGQGYYSYDLGDWHIVVLNSNCDQVAGGCKAGSPQELWLRADLLTHPAQCTLAYWHHPLFSSGRHGDDAGMRPLWQALYDLGADVVLNGHDHHYERFGLQDPEGQPDAENGIRQFVVGTGGRGLRPLLRRNPNSEVRSSSTFGVLEMTLWPDRYEWEFIPVPGGEFTDRGSEACR